MLTPAKNINQNTISLIYLKCHQDWYYFNSKGE